MNTAIIVGNLGADPEMRYTAGGKAVAELRVATQGVGKDAPADWHRVIVWEQQAENCSKYLTKGSKVGVMGRIQYRTYDDKDGNKRYITEIVANNVEFLSKGGSGGATEEDPF